MIATLTLCLGSLTPVAMPSPAWSSVCAQVSYKEDIAAALELVEKECGPLLKPKGISFKKIEKDFLKAAKKVKTDQDHYDPAKFGWKATQQ